MLTRRIGQLIKKGDTSRDIAAKLAPVQQRRAQEFLEGAAEALPRKYGEVLEGTFKLAEARGMKVNVSEVVESSLKNMENAGLGRLETTKNGRFILRAFSPEEVAERLGKVEPLTSRDLRSLNEVVGTLNRYSQVGELQGRQAAETLANINKSMNQLFSRFQADPALKRVGAIASGEFKNQINNQFAKVGLADRWAKGAKLYAEYDKTVKAAIKIANSEGGTGLFIDRLLKDSGAGKRARGISEKLLELNPAMKASYDELIRDEATIRFTSWLPREGLISRSAAYGGGLGAATFIDPLAGIGVLGAASPRIMANANRVVPYAFQALDAVKGMGPRQLGALLKNQDATRALFQMSLGAAEREQQQLEQVMQEVQGGRQ